MSQQLNADSLSESEVKEDDDLGPSEVSLKALEIAKKGKRKRKNKKKKPFNPTSKSSEDNLEDEVEKSVREVNKILGEASETNPEDPERPQQQRGLLSVEPKNLNPENEMKRLFGSKVVMADRHRRQNQRHRSS